MAVESQVRRIEIKIDTQGDRSLKTIARGFSEVNKSIKSSTQVMSSFRNAFLAIQGLSFAGIGIREVVQASDAMQKLGDRLTITEGGAVGAAARLKDLTSVANANYTSIDDSATIYSRLSMALSDVGISSRELITLTDNLQKTFRLSGATASEATAATIQLSQGLASGQIRGQELRSVLEANVVIGGLLAKQLGVTRGELLKFAEKQNGISAVDFLKAVSEGAKDLNSAAEKLKPTIQDALTRNLNDLKIKLVEVNKEFGLTEKAIKIVDLAFKNLDLILLGAGIAGLVKTVLALKTAWVTLAVAIGPTVAYLGSIGGALANTAVAVGALIAPFISLPLAITAAVTSFVLAFSTITDFRKGVLSAVDSLWEFITVGSRTPDFQKKYYAQKKAAEDLASAQKQLNRSFVLQNDTNGKVYDSYSKLFDEIVSGKNSLGPIEKLFDSTSGSLLKVSKGAFDFKKALAELNEKQMSGSITVAQYNKELRQLKIEDLNEDYKKGGLDLEQYNKRLKEIEFGKLKNNVKEFQFDLRGLNREFGEYGDVAEYSRILSSVQMDKLSADFKEGKINLNDLNKGMSDLAIEEYNRQIAQGSINLKEYISQVNATKLQELNNEFKSGKISVAEYHAEIVSLSEEFNSNSALFTGVNNYIQSAGTISQNVANGVTQVFGHLEDSMMEFINTGKYNWRKFTASVLEDLNRIIIRSLIIRPLAQGILGAISPTAGAASGAPTTYGGRSSEYSGLQSAKGSAFMGSGARFFASGGVVNGATPFSYGGGKLGVMGEAGPEAILPLRRGANGDLGVKAAPSNVVVNVINQSGAETEQRESTNANGDRVIDILIVNKVKEGFANGAFDRQMSQQYGLRRRGA